MTENSFYRAFEDQHRGSRELIKSRLNVYRPFIEPLITPDEQYQGIDLGCGRGEWLEILGEMRISAVGVDLDQGMLSACSERGLKAIHGDAIAYLATLENNSQLVVSAFHVVEHISFDQLQNLVSEAHRVLKPGGLLIMETPNPENIMVATCSFYLDPTHVRPIPPDLLIFMTEFCGFFRSKILRLQEGSQTAHSTSLNLNHVLGGASPDYAVVAQKAAADDIQSKCDYAFNLEYGIDTITLANNYSDQQNQKFEVLQYGLQQAESKAQQAESKAQQAESKAQQAEQTLNTIYSGFSWRITRPLRWLSAWRRKIKQQGIYTVFIRKLYFRTLGRIRVVRDPESHMRQFLYSIFPKNSRKSPPEEMGGLSGQAQKIYFKLKAKV